MIIFLQLTFVASSHDLNQNSGKKDFFNFLFLEFCVIAL